MAALQALISQHLHSTTSTYTSRCQHYQHLQLLTTSIYSTAFYFVSLSSFQKLGAMKGKETP